MTLGLSQALPKLFSNVQHGCTSIGHLSNARNAYNTANIFVLHTVGLHRDKYTNLIDCEGEKATD